MCITLRGVGSFVSKHSAGMSYGVIATVPVHKACTSNCNDQDTAICRSTSKPSTSNINL